MRSIIIYISLILLIIPDIDAQHRGRDFRTQASYYGEEDLKEKFQYYFDYWSEQQVKHGRYSRWDKSGQLRFDAMYFEGELDGRAISYYPDGGIARIEHYMKGEPDSVWLSYRSDGSLEQRIDFLEGMRVQYDEASQPKWQQSLESGSPRIFLNTEGEERAAPWHYRILHPFQSSSPSSNEDEVPADSTKSAVEQKEGQTFLISPSSKYSPFFTHLSPNYSALLFHYFSKTLNEKRPELKLLTDRIKPIGIIKYC